MPLLQVSWILGSFMERWEASLRGQHGLIVSLFLERGEAVEMTLSGRSQPEAIKQQEVSN